MKRTIKGFGIAAFAAMLVFTLAGCGSPDSPGTGIDPGTDPGTQPVGDTVINIAAIQGVTIPAKDESPVTGITENEQYSGTVSWKTADGAAFTGVFTASTVYTATITLTAKTGYTFQGVSANFFSVNGTTSVSNSANSGVITAVFPSTSATTIDITVIAGVTAPVNGETPITGITENDQYSGNVAWSPVHSTFAAVTQYTATITLTPKADYTLQGVGANFFTVEGAVTVSNSVNSGVVTAVFPATAATVVNITAIEGVTAPANGAAPVTGITENEQYSGIISWKNANGETLSGNFAAVTVYTATITLTAKHGYTLEGVAADFFTVTGATTVSNSADSGVVTAAFPATAATPITNPEINITAPVKASVPNTAASSSADSFTAGTVSWSPTNNPFLGGTVYTATVTLTAKTGFTFTGLLTPKINGQTAAVTSNSGGTVTLTYTFPATSTKTVTGIAIKTQPTTLTYTHGDQLNLAGLAVTLTYDDTTTGEVFAVNFTDNNITANPAQGYHFIHSTDNGTPVTVRYGNLQTVTNNLTVNKKTINISAIQGVTVPATGVISVSSVTENEQYTGTVSWNNGNPSTFAPVTAYTATITLTAKVDYTLQGVGTGFFSVAGTSSPATNSANSGVVTAVFPQTAAIVINISAIQGVTPPVLNVTPVTSITENDQYTGTVTWNGNPSIFAGLTQYTATITLTAKHGYTLQGVTAGFFTVAGATTVNNSANSGVVTAVFPATVADNFTAVPTLTLTVFGTSFAYTATPPTPTADSYDIYYKEGSGLTTAEIKTTGTKITAASNSGTITDLTNGVFYSVLVTANKAGFNSVDSAVRTEKTVFTTVADLGTWLNNQPENSWLNPYRVVMNITFFPSNFKTQLTRYIYLDLSGSTLQTIPDEAFWSTLENTKSSFLAEITIPDTVTSIGTRAFLGANLATLTIPDSVINIGERAFYGCNRLTSVTIGNSVTSIGPEAFRNCSNLTSLTLGNSVTSIGNYAFQNCTKLGGTFIIPDSVTSIGNYAFQYCRFTSLIIGAGVTSIGNLAFDNSYITSVRFDGTITEGYFRTDAFYYSGISSAGNLRAEYLANGPGTYTRPDNTTATWNSWSKQEP
jgi:hypothetical protein